MIIHYVKRLYIYRITFFANHKTSFYSGIQTLLTGYNLPREIIPQNRISINESQNIKNKYIEFWQDKVLLSNKLSRRPAVSRVI